MRVSVFVDAGQIYVNGSQPEFENFRYSAGVGRRVELAARTAQVQLRVSAQHEARRQDPEVPVPGRHGVLMRHATMQQENRLKRSTPSSSPLSPWRSARLGRGYRAAPPTTRSASSTPSACSARRRRPSARSRSSRRSSRRATPRSQKLTKQVRDLQTSLDKDGADDGRGRAAQQGARSRQPVARPAAHAARVPRGPQPAPQRGARRPCRSARTRSSSRSPRPRNST